LSTWVIQSALLVFFLIILIISNGKHRTHIVLYSECLPWIVPPKFKQPSEARWLSGFWQNLLMAKNVKKSIPRHFDRAMQKLVWTDDIEKKVWDYNNQGCQIFLGTTNRNGKKYSQWLQIIPKGHICNIPTGHETISVPRPSKIYQNDIIGLQIYIPSGNPA
jgi:hypothetical protein